MRFYRARDRPGIGNSEVGKRRSNSVSLNFPSRAEVEIFQKLPGGEIYENEISEFRRFFDF